MELSSYRARIESGGLKPDEAQIRAASALGALAQALAGYRPAGGGGIFKRLQRARGPAPKGLYIWGAVGRGKTALMDLFFDEAGVEPKRRVHFHRFMQDVHAAMHEARKGRSAENALEQCAATIAASAGLLCLDEMQVADIADAMILGRLFDALHGHGVVIVATSNLPPRELYKDGLNRQLFLPFIAMLEQRLDVVELAGAVDYRLGRVKAYESFITPLGRDADTKIDALWSRLTDGATAAPETLDVVGRKLRVPAAAHGAARFSFQALCGEPLGPADFLALAAHYATLFVENIPALDAAKRNEAKRFVLLIDALYDARRHFVASSARPPSGIYPAGDHSFEFARTVSRLEEMQSAAWWGRPIAET